MKPAPSWVATKPVPEVAPVTVQTFPDIDPDTGATGGAPRRLDGRDQAADIVSRPPELPVGAEVSAQGGNVSVARAWSGPAGTRVEVKVALDSGCRSGASIRPRR
jgi:hypothetical protein